MSPVPQSGFGASSDSDSRHSGDVVESGRTALDNKTSLLNMPSPRSFAGPRFREYNPYNYTDSISTLDKAALKEALYEGAVEQLRDGEIGMSSNQVMSCLKMNVFHVSCYLLQCIAKNVLKTSS